MIITRYLITIDISLQTPYSTPMCYEQSPFEVYDMGAICKFPVWYEVRFRKKDMQPIGMTFEERQINGRFETRSGYYFEAKIFARVEAGNLIPG